MSNTLSNMLPLGTIAPYFNLLDTVSNQYKSLNDIIGSRGTVIMFLSNHCPFVKHINDEIVRVANDYRVSGFGFVAISSNDVENYPQDGPAKMWETARKEDYNFPIYTTKAKVPQRHTMPPALLIFTFLTPV